MKVLFVGKPNVGKSLLINRIIKAYKHDTANISGVTTKEKKSIIIKKKIKYTLIDLPGIYSLSSTKLDEEITINKLLSLEYDLIVNVIDGRDIKNNLYITLQLLEMQLPIVVLINFKDKYKNLNFNFEKLSKIIKTDVLSISALKDKDFSSLFSLFERHNSMKKEIINKLPFLYDDALTQLYIDIKNIFTDKKIDDIQKRYSILQLINQNKLVLSKFKQLNNKKYKKINEILFNFEKEHNEKSEIWLTKQRHIYLENILSVVIKKKHIIQNKITDKLDKIFFNKYISLPVAIFSLFFIFVIVFSVSTPIKD